MDKQPKEIVPPAWPGPLRGAPTFKADAAANKHCPPIKNEREQMQRVKQVAARGGKK